MSNKELRYNHIHIVDTLNSNSLIAKAAANKYLTRKPIEVSSSGVLVNLPKKIRFGRAIGLTGSYLDAAVQKGVVTRQYVNKIRNEKDLDELKCFLENRKIGQEILLWKILDEKGMLDDENAVLGGYVKNYEVDEPTQTSAITKGKSLIIAMSGLAYERAKHINSGSKNNPSIIELRHFLGLGHEIPDLSLITRPLPKGKKLVLQKSFEAQYQEAVEAAKEIIKATNSALEIMIG